MSNLTITPKWNTAINQVEISEYITGGASGNANQATRQLAENVFWLKQQTESEVQELQKLKPATSDFSEIGEFSFQLLKGSEMTGANLKFGRQDVDNGERVNFETPFENACFQVIVSQRSSTGTVHAVSTNTPDNAGFTVYHGAPNDITVAYIAIGY